MHDKSPLAVIGNSYFAQKPNRRPVMNLSSVVYIGFWTDYQRGDISGLMLTLDTRSATTLMAILVILVGFAGNRSWKIWAFFLHAMYHPLNRLFQTPVACPVRHQQVILRNTETAGGALLSLASYTFNFCRGTAIFSRKMATTVLLAFFVFAHYGAFVVFGVLTSKISVGNSVRSIDTPDCGEWISNITLPKNYTREEALQYELTNAELMLNDTVDAESYVRGCYGQLSEGPGVLDCRTLPQRSLPYSTQMNRCPFQDGTCLIKDRDRSAFTMDTGNISFSQLGLNSKFSERLFFRRRTVCSPITMEPFLYSRQNVQTELQDTNKTGVDPEAFGLYAFFKYPSGKNASYLFRYNSTGYDVTAFYTLDTDILPPLPPLQTPVSSYTLSVITIRGPTILFLKNSSDPLFFVQSETDGASEGYDLTLYRMSRPINSIACQEMAILCSDVTHYCTNWTGLAQTMLFGDIIRDLLGSQADDEGSSAVVLASHALVSSTIYQSVMGRTLSALQASRYLTNNIQTRLADEQWKIELEGWFCIALARIQLYGLRVVKTPAPDHSRIKKYSNESLPDVKKMCNIVKFHSAEHTTLSATWIIIILAFVVLVTIFSFGDSWMAFVWKKGTEGLLKPWENNEKLRLLLEAEQMEESSGSSLGEVKNTSEVTETGFLIPRKPVSERQ